MALTGKISIRKVIQVFLTLVTTTCCIAAMVSASTVEDAKCVKDVEVHIISGKKYHFVEEQKVEDKAINDRHIDVKATPMEKLDLRAMEQVLEADEWIAHAQIYIDNSRILHIFVTQRVPVARLFKQNGSTCYIDNALHTMGLAENFNFYTTVVTNVPELGNDSNSTAAKKQLLHLVHYIQADTFWSAQISQVVMDTNNTFELVPVMGDQKIIFGDTTLMVRKFTNLSAFYKKVLNRIGWDKYECLDLRFNGQVIASPSLPYKGPKDKDSANMNWLIAYVQQETRKDSIFASIDGKLSDFQKPKPMSPVVLMAVPGDKKAPVTAVAGKKDGGKNVKKESSKLNDRKKADDTHRKTDAVHKKQTDKKVTPARKEPEKKAATQKAPVKNNKENTPAKNIKK
ncbi:MAG: hypothetical protein H7257_01415 [Taibaiella sp.]|nr:hypothetical protein [Taibaiella sp.]